MAWDKFLIGPLGDEERHLVRAFELPETPFAGMEVTVILNGMKDQQDSKVSKGRLHRVRGSFPKGYHEEFRGGAYDSVVKETPDLAIAMNAGFSHYPKSWYPTISLLRRQKVPIIVTGFGNHLESVYKYDHRLAPQFDGDSLQLPSLPWLSEKSERKTEESYPGFEVAGGPTTHVQVKSYKDAEGRSIQARHLPLNRHAGITALLVEEDGKTSVKHLDNACSDAHGAMYMARRTDFEVKLALENPFRICDPNHDMHCNANGVVLLLEPGQKAVSEIPSKPPRGLFRDTLRRFLPCFTEKQQRCLKKRLAKWSLQELDDLGLVDDFFYKNQKHCLF